MPKLYHGTSITMLESILANGLLSRERLEAIGKIVVHPDYTKKGSVYFTTVDHTAMGWGDYHPDTHKKTSNTIILVVQSTEEDESKIIPDRNFYDQANLCEGWEKKFRHLEYRADCFPAERLNVLVGDEEIPLRQYVESMKATA